MYAPMQRGLHHLVAGLILVMLPLGLLLPHLDEGDLASVLYEVHKSLGMSVFALVLIRLALRIYMGAPPDPTAVHPLLYSLAKLGHGLLYILILGLPMLGYTATSVCCKPVVFFGLVPVPLEFSGSEDLAKQIFKAHQWGAWLLGVTALGHITMAFWHSAQKDGVFERMWPDQSSSGGMGGAA